MGRKSSLLTVDDVRGAWAIMPTPARPGASDWRMEETVDLDETARVVEKLIESGVDAIVSLGTFGEGASLTWDEKRQFMATVVETVRGRVPYFCGTTSLNTRETIRQTRAAYDIGCDGTMLGLPMWQIADVPTAVQFFRSVAEACPEMAICVYANSETFKFDFPRQFWAQVCEIPQVITAKYLGIGSLVPDLNLSKRKIRFLPFDADYYAAARIDPDFCTAFWTSGAVCGPAPVLRLRDEIAKAKKSADWTQARMVSEAISRTYATLFPNGSFKDFSTYNIGLEKARMNAAGWMYAGPCRPPYHLVPEAYLEGARLSGTRWAELHQQYSAEAAR
ncbi:trans-o-hydroxybenzylidenepyruvate hydratase-aldolase [Janthinobacterium sp. 67]|uniref:dihydrodipicolinate synthase family protein n=1 Tax=Janthinobacterium sp. 67 TaxID=2035207 RepID=UPI000CA82BF8|nr:dihydrodipicolinate synthase family protein [Janthinobacterium sp. 67]PJJ06708.1 trans-o-hydroxybenzylidenepyruvate hydratase-aldolase [Janthinobacterium sp. 67]